MSFDKTKLATWPDTTSTRRGRYSTNDAKATVLAANYFNDAYPALPKGTVIDVTCAMDTTPVLITVVVTASSSAGVTVALQTVA